MKDWEIYDIYNDEGISGKNIVDRPAMNRLIEDIESKKVKNVLVFKVDRLTRSTRSLIELVDLIEENKCTFNSLTDRIKSSIQSCSDKYFDETAKGEMHMSEQSFSEVRTKIKREAFAELHKHTTGTTVNVNLAAGTLKDCFIAVMLEPDSGKRKKMISHILTLPARPDRDVPRNPYPCNAKFYHNIKSNCR